MPKTATDQRQVHYDRHSRTLPMEQCAVGACMTAASRPAAMPEPENRDTHVTSRDRYRREVLTVDQLRDMLAGIDGDLHVVVATDGWYVNVAKTVIPASSFDGEYMCVTLFPGDAFDSRQC